MFDPDPDIAYEYTGDQCKDSGIFDIVQLGDGLDLEFDAKDVVYSPNFVSSFDCIFDDYQHGLEMTGKDADASDFIEGLLFGF